jgi:DNA-binding XRE family transcriptional regulator
MEKKDKLPEGEFLIDGLRKFAVEKADLKETQREKKAREALVILGEKIKAKRLKKGITQLDLGEAVGCNQDNISRIESGKVNLTIESLSNIADSLGVTLGYFFK